LTVAALDRLLVFTHPECPHSRALLADFRARGVVFRAIDLVDEPHEMERLRTWCWVHRLPVVVDHERVSIGYLGKSSTFEELDLTM
jgi:arsenate reductase-like glutaredoxin family protein